MNYQFEVGQTYRNRSGNYEVLALDESRMYVRFEDGREQNLTLAIQAQILQGIQRVEEEAASKAPPRKRGAAKKRKANAGPTKAEEREILVAEILENDGAIFEILTRLVIPPGQINTYRFFLQNPPNFFSQQQIADATRNSNQESLRGVFMAFGRRIGKSPDPRVSSLNPRNALFFENKRSDGVTLYRMRQRVLDIFATYPQFHDFLMNDNRSWLPDEFGSPQWESTTAVHHAQLHYFGFWDRYQDGR